MVDVLVFPVANVEVVILVFDGEGVFEDGDQQYIDEAIF
jgi:hypothetical protein